MFFAGSDAKDNKNRFVIFLVAIGLFIAGTIFIQLDIKTTALFYDSVGMRVVMDGSAPIGGVSKEAWIAGITLSLFQVYVSFRLVMAKGKKHIFRWIIDEKLIWLATLITVAVFDTLTDVDFRSFGMRDGALTLKVFLVSLIVYNFGSEWALGTGFREIVQFLGLVFGGIRAKNKVLKTEEKKDAPKPPMGPLPMPDARFAAPPGKPMPKPGSGFRPPIPQNLKGSLPPKG